MGVGIVPLQSVIEDVDKGKLVRWWIEGAQINWELGLAQLTGGYESPIMQTFIRLSRTMFTSDGTPKAAKKKAARKKR